MKYEEKKAINSAHTNKHIRLISQTDKEKGLQTKKDDEKREYITF